ncbi:MAG: hypothetical protein PHQ23_11170 [Candidatus Wallbacteria bacterium]|nr:hypothetical protein [Candidatus Wallbacteria bacterium]
MKRTCAFFFMAIFLIGSLSRAADITATLDSADGTSGFSFRDSGSTEIGRIDSDGNFNILGKLGIGIAVPGASLEVNGSAVIRSGLRLDAGGVKCDTAEMLIVDGKIGVNTTNPGYLITACGSSEWSIASVYSTATATHRNHFLAQKSNAGAALGSGYYLGGLAMGGYNGTSYTKGWNGGAEITAVATEDWTAANNGTKLVFNLTKNGTSNIFQALEIGNDAKIVSPMWKVTQVMDAVTGAMPKTSAAFATGGGTLLIIASGSGYWNALGGAQIGMSVALDAVIKGYCKVYTNEASSHRAFTTNPIVATGIAAGNHTITVASWNGTASDANDFYNVTVLELPF